MKKMFKYTLIVIATSLAIVSCKKVKNNSSITVRNTFQSAAASPNGTDGNELAIEGLFGVPASSLEATADFSKDDVEFPAYLKGLYDIKFNKKSIEYTLVAKADDATYGSLFRVIEAGSFDRYYFTFDKKHRIKSGESSNASVNFRVISDTEVVVEITEGYDFKPGMQFTIDLK